MFDVCEEIDEGKGGGTYNNESQGHEGRMIPEERDRGLGGLG